LAFQFVVSTWSARRLAAACGPADRITRTRTLPDFRPHHDDLPNPFDVCHGSLLARRTAGAIEREGKACMARATILIFAGCLISAAAASAQDLARGEKVYADQKCGLCHSIGDKGNKKGPLDGVGAKLSATDIRAWMVDAPGMTEKTKSARKPVMKSYALPKDDLDALVAYLASLKKK